MSVNLGLYRHFKGKIYQVEGTAEHTETGENLVIYSEKNKQRLWARSESMFTDHVLNKGKMVPRFFFLYDNNLPVS